MRTRACRRFLILFVVVFATRSLAALASPAADAEAAIKRGIELRRKGDDAQALEEFKGAYALSKSARALGQIGFAEQALGRWREAEEHLGQALADGDDGWIKKNRVTLEKSRAAVSTHLGNLEILGGPEGAEVLVDGRLAGTLPLARPLRVAAGTIGIEVRAERYLPASRSVTIVVGELSRETVSLQKVSTAVTASPPPALAPDPARTAVEPAAASQGVPRPLTTIDSGPPKDDAGSSARSAAWVTGGGAVLFTGGLVAGLLTRKHYDDQVSARLHDGTCTQDGTQFKGPQGPACATAATNRSQAAILSIVSGGLAAALAITSAILFVSSPPARPKALACAPSIAGPAFGAQMGFGCDFRF